MLRFESTLALRHLRSGGGQTLLTISAVAAGVILVIFISSLMFGVRAHVREILTDMLPHVAVTPPEPKPAPLEAGESGGPVMTRLERQTQQQKEIDDWPRAVATIRSLPGVVTVAPTVSGQAFVSRGGKQVGAQLTGADPELLDRINPITKYLIAGRYKGLQTGDVFLSYKVANDLGVGVGDRVRLTSPEGSSDSLTIAGIYDNRQDTSTAFVTLRTAQSLYGTGTSVQSVLVKVDDLMNADAVADRIMALLPYEAKSWSRLYPQFVSYLGVYRAIAFLVSGFALIASAFAIAAVLIVSVLQKSKQIGILKSIGAKRRQILAVFLLEGLGIALIGASVGAALGIGLVRALALVKQPVTRAGAAPETLYPFDLSWQIVAAGMLAAILSTLLAAALPARSAARMNPVEVMR